MGMAETYDEFVPSPELVALARGPARVLLLSRMLRELSEKAKVGKLDPEERKERDRLSRLLCDQAGLTGYVKSMSSGGKLPPHWPEADLVPIAFNFEHKIVGCDVRTIYHGEVHYVRTAIRTMEKSEIGAAGNEAIERGKHELRKRFKKMR